jgi:abortive infection bacteriophage resistance protein
MKAKTRKEIAFEYGINVKTLTRWLRNYEIILERGLITPKKQLEIYNKLGCPISTK